MDKEESEEISEEELEGLIGAILEEELPEEKNSNSIKELSSEDSKEDFGFSKNILTTGPRLAERIVRQEGRSREIALEDDIAEDIAALSPVIEEGDYREGASRRDVLKRDVRIEDKEKHFYDEGNNEKEFYETGHVELKRDRASSNLYEGRLRMESRDQSWGVDTRTEHRPFDESFGRALSDADFIDARDMVEGQTFIGPGERDGFESMASKGDYDSHR